MNILLTGGNGFLAKELYKYFSTGPKKIRVFSPGRNTLDVADPANVRLFFEQIDVDVVVHTAVKGGKRFHQDSIDDLFTNVAMYQNLLNFSHKFKIMFNFGSGAEFDRRYPIDVAVEEDIEERLPQDYYGMSKNLISRQILKKDDNIYNLRLYGCFGEFEEEQRLFRGCYDRLSTGQNAIIPQDKYMDYFYAQDVGKVISHIIAHRKENLPRDINLCYPTKYRLSEYAEQVKNLTDAPGGVIIEDNTIGKPYTGDSSKLDELNIDFIGIEGGTYECLKSWNKS